MGQRTRLEYQDEKSQKFWEVQRIGDELHLRWGRLGTDGQAKTKKLASSEAAKSEEAKLVASKKQKGYSEASTGRTPKKQPRTEKKATAKKATAKRSATKSQAKSEGMNVPSQRKIENSVRFLIDCEFSDRDYLENEKKLADAWIAGSHGLDEGTWDAIHGRMVGESAGQRFQAQRLAQRILREAVTPELERRMLTMYEDESLEKRLLLAARSRGELRQLARLLFAFRDAPYVGAVVKKLKKTEEPSPELVAALQDVVEQNLTAWQWMEERYLSTILILGIILRFGSQDAVETLRPLRDKLVEFTRGDSVRDMGDTFQHLLDSFGRSLEERPPGERSPAEDLAHALGWSVAGKEWRARLVLGEGKPNSWFGAMQRSTQVSLGLSPSEKPFWQVTIRDQENERLYSNWTGDVTQDDFGLPSLERLENFPEWLRASERPLKTAFDRDQGIYDTGRHRKLQKELRSWLK